MKNKKMNLVDKTDEEILKIANPLWDDLVKHSNKKDILVLLRIFQQKCCLVLTKLK